ncbi:MAG: BTAD domain-containing putative transcriptional regulator [Candidatus Limnocylindria bacterium]
MRFEALGPLVATRDGSPVALAPAQRRLLASMLLTPGVPSTIDSLIDRMWDEEPPRTAVQAMHVHLSSLRRNLPGIVQALNGWYAVDLEDHESDVREFSTLAADAAVHLAQGRFRDAAVAATRASRLWRGDPYPELADLESARGERERLAELWIATRTTEARALTLQGRVSEAIALLRQLVTEQPLNETLWEELVLAYCAGGRPAEARSALADARAVLRTELAVAPGPRLVELERRIEHGDPALLDGAGGAVPHNLPLFDSSFVGRDDDMGAITELLARHHLVTITGPPGIGKTRLAIEAAARALADQPAGAWLVRLVGAGTPADVLSTVTTVTGITEVVEDLGQLYRLVAPRPMLLVLDNCEHVLDAVRQLLADRRHGDRLRVLATSRSALEIGDEVVWALRPISLAGDQAEMWESATLRLLADRVADVDPRIALDRTDPSVLMELCRRTGGMPLAIELVARRVATLDPERVTALGFASAEDASASDLPLESSVARAISRSVAVLGTADRRRFAAASAFAAAFTIDAFASICMGSGDVERAADAVRRLCGASLLVPDRTIGNAVRYRMLEPLRDFGLQRLSSTGREQALRDRHAAWYVDEARTVAEASWTHAEAEMLDEVDISIADYRAAMRHLLDRGRPHLAAEIAAGLVQFWISRFLAREGERWLDECLASDMDDRLRLAVLAAASGVAFFTGRYDESEAFCDEVLEIATRLGDRRLEAQALYGKGRVQIHRRPAEGRALTEEAIAIYEAIGDRVTAAECRVAIGIQAAYAADRAAAEAILGDATALLEAGGYPKIAAVGHRHLSLAAWHDGDEAAARRHLAAALSLAERANDRRVLSGVLAQQGMVEGRWGDSAVAADALVQALNLVSGQHEIYFSLVAFGALEILVARGEWSMAAQLLAHFDRVHATHGWIPLDQRNAAARGYRRRIDEALSGTGEHRDLAPMSTAAMAARLIEALQVPVSAS